MKKNRSRVRILYVDDDEDDLIFFQRTLRQLPNNNYQLHYETDHERATRWLRQYSCDVLFVDFYLGNETGLALIRGVREMGLAIPAIVLTGQSSPDVDTQALYGGADEYLEKSHLNPTLLDRSIRYALERKRHVSLLTERQNQLERLSKKLLAIQEKERKRLARELHDSVSSTLTAVKYALEEIIYYRKTGDAAGGPALESILSWLKQAIGETRALCSRLRPAVLDDLGLQPAVESLCKRTNQISEGLEVVSRCQLGSGDFSEDVKIAAYRILQEALNNVNKHSEAKNAEVSLIEMGDELILSVKDDGIGFNPRHNGKPDHESGFGLDSIRERTEFLGGRFEIYSEPRKGTQIRCRWPK